MSEEAVLALPYLFDFWAMGHQLPPESDWKTWVILGGRGAGKTRAGAEWVRSQVEGAKPLDKGRARRVEPPRVYRRVFRSNIMLLYQGYSDLHRMPPLLLV
ncbi:MAG: hypothetical protein ACI9ZD_002356, partial [Paracoccaceae bacterium]